MSRTKKLTRARRREREQQAENFSLLMAAAEMQIKNRRLAAEMERVKEELRPAVERIMAIRLNDVWHFLEPVEQHHYAAVHAALDIQPFRVRTIDTHRKLEITVAVADEVLLEMIGRDHNDLLEKFFIATGMRMFTRAIDQSRKPRDPLTNPIPEPKLRG